eukprot:SAG31_NODE_4345_length_3329_cov_3.417957_1_plen_29_part_10
MGRLYLVVLPIHFFTRIAFVFGWDTSLSS